MREQETREAIDIEDFPKVVGRHGNDRSGTLDRERIHDIPARTWDVQDDAFSS
jgi:hypothetical protein